MTDFGPDLDSIVSAFPSADLMDTLPIALDPLRQLYIAESEKYAHVTYFLNGGNDHPVNHEVWHKIPSPIDPDYSKVPEMSAALVVDYVIEQINQKNFDIYILNFANADMLGHTGKFEATVEAIEAIDEQIGRLWQVLQAADPKSVLCITADHGNAEEMINLQTKELDTEHSTNPVPLIITKPNLSLRNDGGLANVAPTLLKVLGLEQPKQMTAQSLC
jgi:2,3-bisphosphoglycerate-independent phosphoglycerate mutase